ncbi:hypothetical protein EV182_000845 [Spiromyces aspiralis]|uniref:Uncharacterized protein n=1 Tax=Spiromyces aspiralis TaxID=68401 RepID=A0ACC1HXG2_9FUNG|nr:hypothetical protein EV182_000845 [Spiromyces aspiralis]
MSSQSAAAATPTARILNNYIITIDRPKPSDKAVAQEGPLRAENTGNQEVTEAEVERLRDEHLEWLESVIGNVGTEQQGETHNKVIGKLLHNMYAATLDDDTYKQVKARPEVADIEIDGKVTTQGKNQLL